MTDKNQEWKKYRDKRDGKIVEGKPANDLPKFIVYREEGRAGVVMTGMKHFELVKETPSPEKINNVKSSKLIRILIRRFKSKFKVKKKEKLTII